MVWLTSSVLNIVINPTPLYIIAIAMIVYNAIFALAEGRQPLSKGNLDNNIFLQITLDQIALTLLLYFAGISHNPFIFYFVFHMIIATLLLRGRIPYFMAGQASFFVGTVLLLQYLELIPVIGLRLPHLIQDALFDPHATDGVYLTGIFMAFSSTLWITVYFTSSVHRYIHRIQAEIRQKEKILGIGQLVAGIAHQISNPLDGIQNCLRTIGKGVKGDQHLTQYVQLMTKALERIEQTATRVQTFARPRGLELQDTNVNRVVNGTIKLLGDLKKHGVEIVTELGQVPLAVGDPYTLQEVIFNLCTNALAAMPNGGKLSIRTLSLGVEELSQLKRVAIEVTDTGIGIPDNQIKKIFEPFFTTRADAGGTGLGLGLCRMLISEMFGSIEVRSTVGQGTTFRLVLYAGSNKSKRIKDEDSGR
jgi:signal transduction histidine kinase